MGNTSQLIAAQYPKEWGSESYLGQKWATQFRKDEDIEKTMSENVLPNEPSLSLLEWHRPVAKFFAQYRLDGSGNDMYSLLLSGLRSKGLLGRLFLGSINYDCLLEQAMIELGLSHNYMLNDRAPEGSLPLAKIHGSCNFITDDLSSRRHLLTIANAWIECGFTALPVLGLEGCLRERFSRNKQAFFPVLGLYSPDKPSIVASFIIQNLRKALAEKIRAATKVVLIGLRPNLENDPHLWYPVKQSQALKIGYVGCKDDYGALRGLQGRADHLAEKFIDGVAQVLEYLSG